MQKADVAKTKWVRKTRQFSIALICFALLTIGLLGGTDAKNTRLLKTSNGSYSLEIVDTPEKRSLGLGGRKGLDQSRGMLFVFDTPAVQCFWMKDMHFPIDIIWLDTEKRVIEIAKNISPNTFPQTFCPKVEAKYVVELNAGEASRSGTNVRAKLNF